MKGLPRITRPRKRANNAGLSGFSLIDPAGNWIRVTRRPDDQHEPRSVNDRTEWVTAGGGPLARALENAVVMADSHGNEVQAQRTLAGAVAKHLDAPPAERAAAWAYLAELRMRLDDPAGAQQAVDEVKASLALPGLSPRRPGARRPGPARGRRAMTGRPPRLDRARSPDGSGAFARRRP